MIAALAWLSPGRWMLVLGLAVSLWLGYHAWAAHQQGVGYDRAKAEYAQQAEQVDDKRKAIAAPIEARHRAAVEKIVTITETIIKEVPTYVKDSDCSMPGGFRVHHDAAAHGVLPDPARIADAAPAPAAAIASTVAGNYGTCIEIAQRLTDLQAWVKAQQALSN